MNRPPDIQIYCNCMERVRHHVSIVDSIYSGTINAGHPDLNLELAFLHFRKTLEEIAFSSLSANRERYAAARAGFATEWNARRMLGFVENVNPRFYPVPLTPPQEIAPGHKHFGRVADGFLTREEFVDLYDYGSDLLHSRNPYADRAPAIDPRYPVEVWSRRVKTLLSLHLVQLVGAHALWVVCVPDQGPVEVVAAMADGPFEVV